MKKILIIDDENRTRDLIAKMIDSFGFDVETIPEGESVQSGIKAIETHSPDIVFIDIQMPDGTAHEEFAIKAIKFSALDYLLKPVDTTELKAALEKALAVIEENNGHSQFDALQKNIIPNEKRRLVLKTQQSVHVVELDQIIRCEADRNYTSFFLLDDKKILVSKTLKEYEMLLSGYNFLRVQQSHLINISYVDRYDKKNGGAVVMKNGAEVPLSPAKRELFFKKLENL